MKRIVFTLLLVNFIFTNTFSQNKLTFGINGGLTYASFRGNDYIESFNSRLDFLAGVSFEYQLKDRLSLVSNINYERKTAIDNPFIGIIENPDDPAFYGNIKIKFKNQYLTIPVLLRYKFGSKSDFYVNGGSFLSYLIKSELTNDYDLQTSDETKNYKKFDFGLTLGIGKVFTINNYNKLFIELRNNYGVSNVSNLSTVNNRGIKTNAVNLICNYSFSL